MTDNGKHLFGAIKQIRIFCGEIARMLGDCDRLMREFNWAAPVTAISGSSASINLPHQWIPYEVFRIYRNKETPSIAKSVSVVFDDEWHEGRVDEPIIVASSFQSVNDNDIELEYWDPHWWYLGVAKGKLDATLHVIDSSTKFSKEFVRFREILTFGRVMTEIVDVESIKISLTDALLDLHR